jgi:hypothetical protein
MTLFALSEEYERMRRRAEVAEAEYDQVCTWLAMYFNDQSVGAHDCLRALAESYAPPWHRAFDALCLPENALGEGPLPPEVML